MRKFFSFFAMAAVVLSMASCGDGGNTPEQPDQPEQPKPVGAIKGKFSVAPGKQVYFSKGNLQATTSDKGESWTWSFAENQWDFVGNQVANNAIKGRSDVSDNGSVDLFIWSISDQYYGIHVQDNHFDPLVDWGNNPISNGGNELNLWRTLTQSEWIYLFQTREDAANKYGFAKVNDIPGVVFLPDDWPLSSGLAFTPGATGTSTMTGDWSEVAATNIFDINQWHAMEEKGAVFLPAAGFRQRKDVFAYGYGSGYYWAATLVPNGTKACCIAFFNSSRFFQNYTFDSNEYGLSVRLVQDVK